MPSLKITSKQELIALWTTSNMLAMDYPNLKWFKCIQCNQQKSYIDMQKVDCMTCAIGICKECNEKIEKNKK